MKSSSIEIRKRHAVGQDADSMGSTWQTPISSGFNRVTKPMLAAGIDGTRGIDHVEVGLSRPSALQR
jgi:hypothetical protein